MSFKRQAVLLSRYSELPSRYTRRVTRTSCQSTFNSDAQSVKVSETSAKLSGLRLSVPLKITSAISPPRSDLADCSPRTQRIASSKFDFPQPFGPTIAVTPSWKLKSVLSAKDLKPKSSSDCKCMRPGPKISLRGQYSSLGAVTSKITLLVGSAGQPTATFCAYPASDPSCFQCWNHAPSRRWPPRRPCRSSERNASITSSFARSVFRD